MPQFWLIVSGIFFVAEAITIGFLMFWFGIGALIAMIVSFFTDNIFIQAAVFVVSSSLLILLTKPFVEKFVTKNDKKVNTNVYSVIDKLGIVTEEINPILGQGQIKVEGEVWSAISSDNKVIPKDSTVKITEIKGVKAVVEEKVPSSLT